MPDPRLSVAPDSELARLGARDALPAVSTTRWCASRKAQVVRAIQTGLLREEEACRLYSMTKEELGGWQRIMAEIGQPGLLVTKQARPKSNQSNVRAPKAAFEGATG